MKNIFREPAEPFTFFNYSDFLILIIIYLILYVLIKKQMLKLNTIKKIIIGFFFIFIPMISIKIELNNVYNKFEIVDGFNTLYVIFKFPIWWIMGILNVYLINIKVKNYR
ncbi:hypothetical protein DRF60_12360 [Chryseobacterium elymi]|uniref:Uncharacterized protein n=1 Tax=Chryseobacterium elymi TaxID=395936 RepID=A0A3D9DGT0_9FLAO|nr:hypothetical protein DRF60_12360 [Chryseobacterium elymi]